MKGRLSNPYSELKSLLSSLESGPVSKEREQVIALLAECWDSIEGTDVERTFASKLHRAEALCWEPPLLRFELERHGGTVNGSSRASVHRWAVNFDTRQATVDTRHFRQLYRRDSPFNKKMAAAIADEVCRLASSGVDDPRYKEDKEGRLVFNLKECLGEKAGGNNQTMSGRRKRMRAALVDEMAKRGWKEVFASNRLTFEKPPES